MVVDRGESRMGAWGASGRDAAGGAGRPSSSAVIARCPIPVTTHAHAPT
ncbi:hypothetical protein [Sorangium cellulosum]|nr:hypothetical protein [Sorangium cellulosum]